MIWWSNAEGSLEQQMPSLNLTQGFRTKDGHDTHTHTLAFPAAAKKAAAWLLNLRQTKVPLEEQHLVFNVAADAAKEQLFEKSN